MRFPKSAQEKLENRVKENAFRTLNSERLSVDFASNDYLGFANNDLLFKQSLALLNASKLEYSGSGGSRLISGNHLLYQTAESACCQFFRSEAALIFNSGFDANVGLITSVISRNAVILYDELSHASIRDGISQSKSRSFKFKHNDLNHLRECLSKHKNVELFVVTESIFSMDGDAPDLVELIEVCDAYNAFLILDEAHAVGVFGSGNGLAVQFNVLERIFARIVTFGKAFGCHGAAVLGSGSLRDYLINFSRNFIYTTALPPFNVAAIVASIQLFQENDAPMRELQNRITSFREAIKSHQIESQFGESQSAIQTMLISGNTAVKRAATIVQQAGFNVKAILSPTVPAGQERLRICLHAFNTEGEIQQLVALLKEISFI